MNMTQKTIVDKQVLEQFLEKSEAVGNENILLSAEAFQKTIQEMSFEYIDLPAFQITKDVKAGEKGIAAALVEVDFGIAETGSVVADSKNENKRLATCLAEKLVVMLPLSKVVPQLHHVAAFMEERTASDGGYVAFITGASRTADIERVLTVGVHGPKEMVVYIVNDL
ncbi:MAG: lactate utilization protein C [Marinifilaceae bacterium]